MLDMTEADIDAMTDEGARQQLRACREQQLLQEDQVLEQGLHCTSVPAVTWLWL